MLAALYDYLQMLADSSRDQILGRLRDGTVSFENRLHVTATEDVAADSTGFELIDGHK